MVDLGVITCKKLQGSQPGSSATFGLHSETVTDPRCVGPVLLEPLLASSHWAPASCSWGCGALLAKALPTEMPPRPA